MMHKIYYLLLISLVGFINYGNSQCSVVISGESMICEGDTTVLTASIIDGQPPATYSWSTGVSGAMIEVFPTSTTEYIVTMTDDTMCIATAMLTVVVDPLITPEFNLLNSYCLNETPQDLPLVSENGVNGVWNPSQINTSAVGTTDYVFTPAPFECATSLTISISILDWPDVSFIAPNDICVNAEEQQGLGGGTPPQGTTSGDIGLYSGSGVSDDGNGMTYSFDPASAGVGTHIITYMYTDENGCSASATDEIEVFALPTVTFIALDDLCINAEEQQGLSGGTPPQGTATGDLGFYSGTGVTDNGNGTTYNFDPAAAGVGTHTITYMYTDEYGCSASATDEIEVFALPTVMFSALDDLCFNAGEQSGLGGGMPVQGTASGDIGLYSGAGVTDDGNGMTYSFDPAVAGVGTHTITYMYTDEDGCSASAMDDVEVFDTPIVMFTAPADLCIDAGMQTGLEGGTPVEGSESGDMGVYSGAGVTDDGNGMTYSFDPATAGVGIHTITYMYTDENGCSATAMDDVEVLNLPVVSFTSSPEFCEDNGVQTGLGGGTPVEGTESGDMGVYSGAGVIDDGNGMTYSFDPATAGVGTHTITYIYTDENGCSNSAESTIIVNGLEELLISFEMEYCQGDTPESLPSQDDNGSITGTWTPNTIDTSVPGSFQYTFEPNDEFCASDSTFVIQIYNLPEITITGEGDYCEGSTIMLSASSNDAVDYNWEYPDGTMSNMQTITLLNANETNEGVYMVTVTNDNGCTQTSSVSVNVTDEIIPTFDFPTSYCLNSQPEQLPLTSTNGVNGTWNPSVIDATVIGEETYTFTPESSSCAETVDIIITITPLPTVIISSATTMLCEGETLILNAEGAVNYEWTDPNGIMTSGESLIIPNSSTMNTGIYNVIGTDSNGCIDEDNIEIIVMGKVDPEFTIQDTFCLNDEMLVLPTLSGNGIEGIWNPNIISTAAVGTTNYLFTPNTDECANTYSFAVTVLATPNATSSNDGPYCEGEVINLSAGGGVSYEWSSENGFTSEDQNPKIENAKLTSSGIYFVTVTNSNQCQDVASTEVVVNSNPIADASNSGPYCLDETIVLSASGGTTYNWTGPEGFSAMGTEIEIPNSVLSDSGTYQVIVASEFNCLDTAETIVKVLPLPEANVMGSDSICYGEAPVDFKITGTENATVIYTINDQNELMTELDENGMSIIPASNTETQIIKLIEVIDNGPQACSKGLTDSDSATVTVIPLPMLDSDLPDLKVCNDVRVVVNQFVADIDNSIFTWTNSNPGIGLMQSGNGNIEFISKNSFDTSDVMGIIEVLPSYLGCEGASETFEVVVNKGPKADFEPIYWNAGNTTMVKDISFNLDPKNSEIGSSPISTAEFLFDPAVSYSNNESVETIVLSGITDSIIGVSSNQVGEQFISLYLEDLNGCSDTSTTEYTVINQGDCFVSSSINKPRFCVDETFIIEMIYQDSDTTDMNGLNVVDYFLLGDDTLGEITYNTSIPDLKPEFKFFQPGTYDIAIVWSELNNPECFKDTNNLSILIEPKPSIGLFQSNAQFSSRDTVQICDTLSTVLQLININPEEGEVRYSITSISDSTDILMNNSSNYFNGNFSIPLNTLEKGIYSICDFEILYEEDVPNCSFSNDTCFVFEVIECGKSAVLSEFNTGNFVESPELYCIDGCYDFELNNLDDTYGPNNDKGVLRYMLSNTRFTETEFDNDTIFTTASNTYIQDSSVFCFKDLLAQDPTFLEDNEYFLYVTLKRPDLAFTLISNLPKAIKIYPNPNVEAFRDSSIDEYCINDSNIEINVEDMNTVGLELVNDSSIVWQSLNSNVDEIIRNKSNNFFMDTVKIYLKASEFDGEDKAGFTSIYGYHIDNGLSCFDTAEIILPLKSDTIALNPEGAFIKWWPGNILSTSFRLDSTDTEYFYQWGRNDSLLAETNWYLKIVENHFTDKGEPIADDGNIVNYWVDVWTNETKGCPLRLFYSGDGFQPRHKINSVQDSEVIIYPNPNSGQFNINVLNFDDNIDQINITDRLGQTLYSSRGDQLSPPFEFSLDHFLSGVYMVNLTYTNGTLISKKMIIIK